LRARGLDNVNVIIPVAGLGTRLRPHTWSRPKPLVSVAGKPMLGHVLDRLTQLTLDRVVFVTGYLGEQIEEFVQANYSFDAAYVPQRSPRGQSDAVVRARGQIAGPTLIVFPDMLFEAELECLETADYDGAIFVKQVEDPRRFGVVELDGDGRVTRFVEKPSEPVSDLAIMGIYYVREIRKLFDAIDEQMHRNIQTKGEFFLADALQLLIDKGCDYRAIPATEWEDCGTTAALLSTNRYMLSRNLAAPEIPGSVIIPPVFIHPTATVTSSVIGPYASLGENVLVEHAIVRDSIIDNGAHIESAMLTTSIVGRNAFVRGEPLRVNVGDSADIDLRTPSENGRG
jgi:glucose-1-phosphate thymidylyltransferase